MTNLAAADRIYLGSRAVDRVYRGAVQVWPYTVIVDPGYIHPSATFSRLSSGTYWGADKLIHTAAAGTPRWEHDPLTGALRGLLVEAQRTNKILKSAAAWPWPDAAYTPRVTLTQGAGVAPDGTTTATLMEIVEPDNDGQHGYGPNGGGLSVDPDDVWTYSVHVARAGYDVGYLKPDNNANPRADYDLSTGAITVAAGAVAAGAEPWTGGYRVWAASTMAEVGIERYSFINLGQPNVAPGYVGGIHLSCTQVESGAAPTSYIPTSGAAATRARDTLTHPRPGAAGTLLIEHDAPAGQTLIDCGGAILVSEGPGKVALAWDASGSMTVQDGAAGAAGAALSWTDPDMQLLPDANAILARCHYYQRRLSESELQEITA